MRNVFQMNLSRPAMNTMPAFKTGSRILKHLKQVLVICISGIVVSACSNNYVSDIKRGAEYQYVPGFPELRIDAAGYIGPQDETRIRLSANVVESSLIFKKTDNRLSAGLIINVELENQDTDEVSKYDYSASVAKAPDQSTSFTEDVYFFAREIDTAPGRYKVKVAITDISSQKTTLRETDAFIPDPSAEVSNITNIRLFSKDNESDKNSAYMPVTTYDVGLNADSLKFEFQVTNNKPENPITIQSRLIRFRSDTSIARPMSFSNYSSTSLPFKGVDYREFEVIQSSRRVLTDPGSVVIEFEYTNLPRGNYRFEAGTDLETKGPLYKGRDFSIKSPNYPSVQSARELARPLVYLMGEGDHKKLMAIEDTDSLKRAMDRFWLENINNSAKARSVIELYYERVVEANKMFANFKEGWKTDPGMIYILFGPPLDEDKRLKQVRWSYKFNQDDPDYTYFFRISKTKTRFYPFDNLLLERSNRYFNIEYRQRELWLSGNILQTQH